MLFVHSVVFDGEKFNHASQLIFLTRENKLNDKSLKFNHLWTLLFWVKSRFVFWLINLDFQICNLVPRLTSSSISINWKREMHHLCVKYSSRGNQSPRDSWQWCVGSSIEPARKAANPLKSLRWCASYAGDRTQYTDRDQTWPSSVRAFMSVRPCRADRSGAVT